MITNLNWLSCLLSFLLLWLIHFHFVLLQINHNYEDFICIFSVKNNKKAVNKIYTAELESSWTVSCRSFSLSVSAHTGSLRAQQGWPSRCPFRMFAAVLRSYLIRLIPVCTAAFIRLQIASPETGTLQGSRAQSRGPWHPVPELRGPFSTPGPDAHSPHVLLLLRAFNIFFSCFFILEFNCAFLSNTTIILIGNSLTVHIRYLLCVPKISLHYLSWMLQLSCLIYWFALCFCPCNCLFAAQNLCLSLLNVAFVVTLSNRIFVFCVHEKARENRRKDRYGSRYSNCSSWHYCNAVGGGRCVCVCVCVSDYECVCAQGTHFQFSYLVF